MDDEKRLIAQLAAGDLDSLAVIYREYGGAMTTLARTLLRDRDEADDVVEDALVRVFEKAGGFRGTGGLKAWTLRIVLNLSRDRLRRRRFIAGDLDDAARIERAGLRVDPVEGWDEALDSATTLAALERAIASLPAEQREAVVLCHRVGLPYAEAAATLGIAEGALRARLFRARAQLKAALAPLAREGGA